MLLIYITHVEISNLIFQLFNVELADQLKVESGNFHISDVGLIGIAGTSWPCWNFLATDATQLNYIAYIHH